MLLTTVREKKTDQATYVRAADRLCSMLAEEALARLPECKADAPGGAARRGFRLGARRGAAPRCPSRRPAAR